MSYLNLRNYLLSIILALFFLITLIIIIFLSYKKLKRLDQVGLTPGDIYRQPRIIFLGSDSQEQYIMETREEKKKPIMPKEVEPYVFYCSECDITSLGYDVFCPVCAKRMKRPELATPKDPEQISCIICHSKICPECKKNITGDDPCYEECPYCERSYHKHCWEKTMQIFGKCGQCLERPPSQLVDGKIKPEETTIEKAPQIEYEPLFQHEFSSTRQEEYVHHEESVPMFQEDHYSSHQWEYERYTKKDSTVLKLNLSEKLLKFKIYLKKKYSNLKERVKILLENRKKSRKNNSQKIQDVDKNEQNIKSKDKTLHQIKQNISLITDTSEREEIIDIDILNSEIYLERIPKLDIEEFNRESYLKSLPKINIEELKKEIALEKQYEKETGKHAIWRGKITKSYLKWKEDLINKKD